MIRLLSHTRRPDISFHRNGTIRIAARVVHALSISPGDTINIAVSGNEYLLYACAHSATDTTVRFQARCYPTKRRSRNYRALSASLCRALLDSIGLSAQSAAFFTGEPLMRDGAVYLPIITLSPL